MEFKFKSLNSSNYCINDLDKVLSPRILVFREQMDFNIEKMRHLLKGIRAGLDLDILCPHVKTHKSSWVTSRLMHHGVKMFKASPNEVDMLIGVGVQEIFIAYPLVSQMAQNLAEKISANPLIQFYVQISQPEHAQALAQIARHKKMQWHYFIDLNVGMNRTGIQPDMAFEFYRSLPQKTDLVFAGLHAYDGHNHLPTLDERRKEAEKSMGALVDAVRVFTSHGVHVPRIVVGGTPSFLPDAEFLYQQNLDCKIYLSPGTWIYFDTTCANKMPNTFVPAAVIFCQVMDTIEPGQYTLNLGHKRWAVDQGGIEVFSVPGMQAVKWSEEHTVVTAPGESNLKIGDYVFFVPRHVCSTVNLWEYFTLIGADGNIEIEQCPIDGRNR